MGATFEWDDAEQTIGHYVLSGNWTWEELNQVMVESWTLIAAKDFLVDSILDFENRYLPSNPLPHLRKMVMGRPTNTGILVAIGAGPIQRSVVSVFTHLYSTTLSRDLPIVFAASLDEAHQILARKKAERGGLVKAS